MVLEILQIGNPILRQVAKEVSDIENERIQKLIDDLISLTLSVNGVGIAAPQVGISERIIIVASHPNPRYPDAPLMSPLAMINPRIVSHSQEMVRGNEGCLSVRGKRGDVSRHREIEVEYYTRDGKFHRRQCSDFVARIIQHEIDHLNGILFVDRLEPVATDFDNSNQDIPVRQFS
ncbi:MAG: peptide deformylase [Geminocystis sp.]|nr:peptide deformylase [Geminocystis sp.]MCS7148503.1 peptide deformylase [Geminocystis sp.]MDW8114923.1 peptide deformylase [Geminocystis sp.]